MSSRNPSLRLKLRPDLAQQFPARARALGLAASTLLAALAWNDSLRPNRKLAQVDTPRKLARSPLSCSLRAPQRRMAMARSAQQSLSLNAYLEALIAAELARPAADLVIYSRSP